MIMTLQPGMARGTAAAIPSKSQAHRLLICAALSDAPSAIECSALSRDILATIACLSAMGITVSRTGRTLTVIPNEPDARPELPCGESGSTLRFLVPIVGARSISGCFHREGRLPQRPMEPLVEQLEAHGMTITEDGPLLYCDGQLQPGDYFLPGDVSSQYITGLLFALPLLEGESRIHLTTNLESAAYIDMTLDVLRLCGISVEETEDGWRVPGGQIPQLPQGLAVEGDWSNAAALLCMGAVSGPVTVTGLRLDSKQGDRKILEILKNFGANVEISEDSVTVSKGALRGIEIDGSEIPDLIPVLSAVAAAAEGTTVIRNAARLRLKESDRLAATAALLNTLGGKAEETEDGLIIHGTGCLKGGTADVRRDHRMAMTAAVCSLICSEPVAVPDAECTDKSWPTFWADFMRLTEQET